MRVSAYFGFDTASGAVVVAQVEVGGEGEEGGRSVGGVATTTSADAAAQAQKANVSQPLAASRCACFVIFFVFELQE